MNFYSVLIYCLTACVNLLLIICLMALLTVVSLLLLASAAVFLLIMSGGRGCDRSPDGQLMKQPDNHLSGITSKQQQIINFKNPSAMLTVPTDSNIHEDYLKWQSKIGNAHCHGGFNYFNGNLVVPRNGIYRVFLQITYQCLDSSAHILRLTNNVLYFTDSYNASLPPLLSSVETMICSMEQWEKSIYTAGLFNLEANTRLFVKSSNPELIVKNEALVFFGAELLA
nr:PREDICTED: lymphotoxin-alpha-like [Paralichthys olivaceus]